MKTRSLWAVSLIVSSLPVWASDKHIEEIVVSAPLGKAAADTALPIGVLSGEAPVSYTHLTLPTTPYV